MKIFNTNLNKEIDISKDETGITIAKKLKKELNGYTALAIKSNGKLKDLNTSIKDKDQVELITFESSEGKKLFWHSSAHLLAQAVLSIFPEAKPTIGPAIDEGFFYDFGDLKLEENDLEKIEVAALNFVKQNISPKRIEYKNEEQARNDFKNNPFKLEIIKGKEETLSAYKQGDFIDLCTGPHIPTFSLIQGFKVLKTSGAYWRGDSKNEQLTRIYGISFPDKNLLKEYLKRKEEELKRDHRLLGSKLNLFSFHEEAPGMPFFHPKGMIIFNELTNLMRTLYKKFDYNEIKTPIMLSRELWERSGHWENYRENIYTSSIDDKQFAIKPMNCPGCFLYFKKGHYSYRQLPLRLAEFGHVHRHELSGALSGLFRVRAFHQDDAHILIRKSDVKDEISKILELANTIYKSFELDYHLELSTRPEKSIGTDEQWENAENGLKEALIASNQKYKINAGDGAFYGPKIDFHIKDCIGRTWQCGTVQLDMSMSERFDLHYDNSKGEKERPIILHRVIYGSIERFIGILIEHFAGRLPFWISPIQVRLLTVADRHINYAKEVMNNFLDNNIRTELDDSTESISKKVRLAQLDQVNLIIVIGDKELESKTLNVRMREGKVFNNLEFSKLNNALQLAKEKRFMQIELENTL